MTKKPRSTSPSTWFEVAIPAHAERVDLLTGALADPRHHRHGGSRAASRRRRSRLLRGGNERERCRRRGQSARRALAHACSRRARDSQRDVERCLDGELAEPLRAGAGRATPHHRSSLGSATGRRTRDDRHQPRRRLRHRSPRDHLALSRSTRGFTSVPACVSQTSGRAPASSRWLPRSSVPRASSPPTSIRRPSTRRAKMPLPTASTTASTQPRHRYRRQTAALATWSSPTSTRILWSR